MITIRRKSLFRMIVIGLMFFNPLAATADPVSWDAQNYRAYAYSSVSEFVGPGEYIIYDEDSQEIFGPPLAISASASASWPLINPQVGASAASTVSTADMQVSTGANACCDLVGYSNAIASFVGSYTAATPYFQFTYSYTGNIDEAFDNAWFWVNDLTMGTNLYSLGLGAFSSNTISVSTPLGHIIEVSYGQEMDSTYGGRTNTLSYSTAVVPEPISSILFVTGGTLFAGRRIKRRKKTSGCQGPPPHP